MFIAALFTIVKTCKQPKCPPTDDWIRKKWCIYTQWNTTQPLKKNEIMPFAIAWMDVEMILISKVSQTEKEKYDISYV